MSDYLAERMRYHGIGAPELALLAANRDLFEKIIPVVLEDFYVGIRNTPGLRDFFRDSAHMDSAKSRQAQHWLKLLSGQYDDDYVRSTQRVGEAHFRIQLSFVDYFEAHSKTTAAILGLINRSRRSGFLRAPTQNNDLTKAVTAVLRLDSDLVIEAYMLARSREQDRAVGLMTSGLERFAGGDFSRPIVGQDEAADGMPRSFDGLRTSYNNAVAAISQAFVKVQGLADHLNRLSGGISEGARNLAVRTESQAASLEQTHASLQSLNDTIRSNRDRANQAETGVSNANQTVQESSGHVMAALGSLQDIRGASTRMANQITAIEEIAFQTNLLALNAGVEAARAGEAGRGFAIVASEVRALAVRSAEAAVQIKALITEVTDAISLGVDKGNRASASMADISARIGDITGLVAKITADSREQASSVNEINTATEHLSEMTQANAALSDEVKAATTGVQEAASDLLTMIQQFRVHDPNRLDMDAVEPIPGGHLAGASEQVSLVA